MDKLLIALITATAIETAFLINMREYSWLLGISKTSINVIKQRNRAKRTSSELNVIIADLAIIDNPLSSFL